MRRKEGQRARFVGKKTLTEERRDAVGKQQHIVRKRKKLKQMRFHVTLIVQGCKR